jgi:hypothetical protein
LHQQLTSKDTKNGCMTYSGIIKLRNNLVSENDISNNELIEFYNKKLAEVFDINYNKDRRSVIR